jgi:hypothetical protein
MAPPIAFRIDPNVSHIRLFAIRILYANHGVGARGDFTACHDSHGVAGADRALEARSRMNDPCDDEDHGMVLGGSGHVVTSNGVAIHGAVVPGRKRCGREHVVGERATERVLERYGLRREWGYVA